LCHGPWPSLSPKARKKEFWDLRIAFPVARKTEEGGVDFYGIHARWGSGDGRGGWVYVPRDIPALPYVIGDLPSAELVVIGESTWDVIAYVDLAGLGAGDYELTVHADAANRAGITHIEPATVQVRINSAKN